MFKIIKKTAILWHHEYNTQILHLSDFEVVSDNTAQTFFLRSLNGSYYPRQAVSINDIVVIDETDASFEETFATVFELEQRLVELQYTPYRSTGGGATTFTELTDTPNSYTGQAGKVATVKATEDGLEFTDPTAGAVGTLQQVTDNGATTTNPVSLVSIDNEILISGDEIYLSKNGGVDGVSVRLPEGTGQFIMNVPFENSTFASRAWVNLQGFITNVITALGYTPANKTGETFTGAISATNLSGTNTGDETTASIQSKRPIKTVAGQSLEGAGNVALSKSDVGLGNVDNTSDLNKPISTAVATALALKLDANSWVDISLTSTITGWAAFTTRQIQYLIIGKELSLYVRLVGTSNSPEAKITLPFNYTGNDTFGDMSVQVTNNGTAQTTSGLARILSNTNEVQFYLNGNLGAFQNTNLKAVTCYLKFKIN